MTSKFERRYYEEGRSVQEQLFYDLDEAESAGEASRIANHYLGMLTRRDGLYVATERLRSFLDEYRSGADPARRGRFIE